MTLDPEARPKVLDKRLAAPVRREAAAAVALARQRADEATAEARWMETYAARVRREAETAAAEARREVADPDLARRAEALDAQAGLAERAAGRAAERAAGITRVVHQEEARAAFAREFGVRRVRWSYCGFTRLLRATGERPARVDEMRSLLGALGAEHWGPNPNHLGRSSGFYRTVTIGGCWDHGELWSRSGCPSIVVGHPYQISDEQRALLAELATRFPGLRVAVDDRPGHHIARTHHVRVELVERRQPWKPFPATYRTREVARAFRKALVEEPR
jgi:hypothetical protein